MAIDLITPILVSGLKWGAGKILDVVWNCLTCGDQREQTIGNVQQNTYGCTNCWRDVNQFTNACEFTVGADRHIGHAASSFRGGWAHNRKPGEEKTSAPTHEGWVYFTTRTQAVGLSGKQFLGRVILLDFDSQVEYTRWDYIYAPTYHASTWKEDWMRIRKSDIPQERRNRKIFAVDLQTLSRYGDLLSEDRLLCKLWQ